jgi:hypothetical protein
VNVLLIVVILAVCCGIFWSISGSEGVASTYERTPLERGAVNETAYLRDDAGWISSVSTVERAMRYFYTKTGVQPYLWIAESIDGSGNVSDEEAESALDALYDDEFTDEGHIAILFLETSGSDYDIYWTAGAQARTVLDQEACDILMDHFIRYYTRDYDDNAYFAQVFTDSADRIMTVQRPLKEKLLFFVLGMAAIIAILALVLKIVSKAAERKRLNAEILNTRIDGDDAIDIEDEADRRAKDYE